MDTTGSRVFAVNVNLPRSYVGKAELSVGPEAVTLAARRVRHYRTIIAACIGVGVVLGAFVLALPASLGVRSITVGVVVAALAAALSLGLRSARGEAQSMRLALGSVSVAKHKGRMLVLIGAFDDRERSGRWTLVADSPEDAEVIVSTLATGGT